MNATGPSHVTSQPAQTWQQATLFLIYNMLHITTIIYYIMNLIKTEIRVGTLREDTNPTAEKSESCIFATLKPPQVGQTCIRRFTAYFADAHGRPESLWSNTKLSLGCNNCLSSRMKNLRDKVAEHSDHRRETKARKVLYELIHSVTLAYSHQGCLSLDPCDPWEVPAWFCFIKHAFPTSQAGF